MSDEGGSEVGGKDRDGGNDRDDGGNDRDGGDDRDDDSPALDEVDVRDLLRRALDKPLGRGPPSVLARVQVRLREQTGGRYFGDGWSTSVSPRQTYLVTSALMLLLIVLTWWLLGPYDIRLP